MEKPEVTNSIHYPPAYNPPYPQHYPNTAENAGQVVIPTVSQQSYNIEMADSVPPEYTQSFEDVNQFSEASIRRGFIRKVYLTLVVQLLITVGIICAFLYWDTLKNWTVRTYWFSFAMMGTTLALVIVLSCCSDLRRKVPLNFILLGLFTIAEGLLLGSVTVYFNAEAVLWAVGATAFVSFGLSVFAMQTKFDFTAVSGLIWILCWTLLSFGLLCAIIRSQYLYIAYASLGTLLFSAYLVMDTQLMLGGKHKYSISPEEYIFAALNLYIDIVTIFLLILQLFGR
ncbi:protein lifeguard 1 [Trichomycterus rosablanca]|uniref:protein lifeguard 1 n=1 Tax=Trichomycterus rosablanca TaxID=2290929 RepID=UPI002F352E62